LGALVVAFGLKVAIYKYHRNEFVDKNEGVGAMAEQSDREIFTHSEKFPSKICRFLKYQCYDQLFSKFSFVLSQKRHFFPKIGKNCRKL
jgi:hypothetical protein